MNRIVMLGALVCALVPCFAHKIRVDYARGVNFSCYRTFRYDCSADAHSKAPFPNQIMRLRIESDIDQAMACRGIKRVATGGDLLLRYRIDVTEQPVFTTFYDWGLPGWGYGAGFWGWGSGYATTTVDMNYIGTLVLDLVDARQKQMVFEGKSTQSISSRPEKNTKKLAKAVREVFERYPPES